MKPLRLFVLLLTVCLAGCSIKLKANNTDQSNLRPTPEHSVVQKDDATGDCDEGKPVNNDQLADDPAPPQQILQPEPDDEDFVKVNTYIPDVIVDLRYSTSNNFTSQAIYDFSDAWLRYGTVKKLRSVQEELKRSGLCLKIWDGFRPISAQFKLWEAYPDPTYVANPNNGFSSHSRGNTVDITVIDLNGSEVSMPTGFDDFSKLADRDYSDCNADAAKNALLLEKIMIKYGFTPYFGEWWHFSDTRSYPVEESFEPVQPMTYSVACNEPIELYAKADFSSKVIANIASNEGISVLAFYGEYACVKYNNVCGYVLCDQIQPNKQ